MRTKRISLLVALVFLIGAMTLPMTAFAAGGKDTTPPTLTAVLDGETVKIVSSDDNSGVEAVYIDKTRVNSLVDGKASVALKDYAGTDKKVSVYAVDYAGNRSDAVQFDNPYYKEPVSTEKPDCALIGQDGNIFNLVGIAERTLREHGLTDQAKEMKDRVFASGSYGEALCIIGEYVNITDTEPEQRPSLRQQLKETKTAEPSARLKPEKQQER